MNEVSPGEEVALRRTADEIFKVDKKAVTSLPVYRLIWGTVTAIDAGPPATLTIKPLGSTSTYSKVRYLSTYSPTVGDVVVGKKYGKDLVILDALKQPVAPLAMMDYDYNKVYMVDMNSNTFLGELSCYPGQGGLVSIMPDGSIVFTSTPAAITAVTYPGGDVWTVDLGDYAAYQSAVDPAGEYVYSCTGPDYSDGPVLKITIASRTVAASLSVGGDFCAMDHAGTWLFVMGSGTTCFVIDLSTFTLHGTITGFPSGGAGYMIVDPANEYLYITSEAGKYIVQIEISSMTIINTLTFTGSSQPTGVVVSDDSSTVYMYDQVADELRQIDASSFTVTDTYSHVGSNAMAYRKGNLYMGVTPDCLVYDASTMTLITTIYVGAEAELATMAKSSV